MGRAVDIRRFHPATSRKRSKLNWLIGANPPQNSIWWDRRILIVRRASRCNRDPVRVHRGMRAWPELKAPAHRRQPRARQQFTLRPISRFWRDAGFGLMEATPSASRGPIPTGTSTRPISILRLFLFQRPRSQPRVTFSMSSLNSDREVTRGRLTRSGMTPRVTDWPAYISKPSHSRSLR